MTYETSLSPGTLVDADVDSHIVGPGFVPISKELGITVEVLSQATAWLILTLGLCVFIMNPIAKIYGKRPVYVFASIVLFIVSVWVRCASSYRTCWSLMYGSRVLWQIRMVAFLEVSLPADYECGHEVLTPFVFRQNSRRSGNGSLRGIGPSDHFRPLLRPPACNENSPVEPFPPLWYCRCWIHFWIYHRGFRL